jgi:hypothetical protein
MRPHGPHIRMQNATHYQNVMRSKICGFCSYTSSCSLYIGSCGLYVGSCSQYASPCGLYCYSWVFFYYFLFKNNKKSYIYVGMKIYICSMKWFYACIKKFTFQKIDMMEVIIPLWAAGSNLTSTVTTCDLI